jgi:hypothetical protein
MRIYIPKHLRELGIFKDLAEMISVYESGYKDPTSSFDSYQSYMKIDPVLRFVSFCIKQEDGQSEEEYRAILDYVTRLFYSVRGTRKVFDYISRYLGIKFVGNPVYTIKSINFSIANDTEWYDVSLFNSYLIDFLNYLLYYESLNYKVDLGIKITEDKEFYCGIGVKTYKIYNIGEVEVEE